MRKARKHIAKYRTEQGAERYCRELRAAWPMYKFETTQHPYEFAWTVVLRCGANYVGKVYVLSRPRGGVAQLGYTGH
jgi:hypothetical protein